MSRPGIVDLRDLSHRYMWDRRKIARFVEAAGLAVAPEPAFRAFAPPAVLVLIVPLLDAPLLARARPWLADAAHLVIVRDGHDSESMDDEERQLVDDEWREALAPFASAITFDWNGDGARAAVEHAVSLARALPPRAERTVRVVDRELPPSEWIAWNVPPYRDGSHVVAASLAWRDDRPVIVDATGAAIDLAQLRGPLSLNASAAEAPERWSDLARHPGRTFYGADPTHPIAWRGHRMAVYWSYMGTHEIGFLSATDHDYPCGPAKKLWGYDDNEPVCVALTPSADACAQRFDHDVLLLNNVPIGWHRAGSVDVALFAPDPLRAALYAQSWEFLDRATDDLLDEDNRELAPAVVLGPSRAVRYAVSLRHRVVRVRGSHDEPSAEIVGGPDEGFAVFDVEHRLVRRATGTLLGGWFRYATIESEGGLFREDLAAGERMRLPSAPGNTTAVVAIPGTRNVIEIAGDRLRVV